MIGEFGSRRLLEVVCRDVSGLTEPERQQDQRAAAGTRQPRAAERTELAR